MEQMTEQVPVLFAKEPEPVPQQTREWKSKYSRAGLSVAALYGTIGVGQSIAGIVIGVVIAMLLAMRALPTFDARAILSDGLPAILRYIESIKGTGIIALLLTIFVLVQSASWGVGFVVMRLINKKGTPIEKRSLSFGRFVVIALMCFGIWGVGAALGNLSAFFGVETQDMLGVEALGIEALPMLLYAVIGAPIVEELTFRKALLDRLHDTHEGYAAVISGLLFGLMHGNHMQFFLAFFLGMLFAMVYQRTGRIVYTMLLHGMINLTASLPELLSLAGIDINLGWNIAVAALVVAGLIVLLVRRKAEPLLHAAPTAVFDANNATYRNVGMRIVRIAAVVMIGLQGLLLIVVGMLSADSDRFALHLIDLIPLTLVFLTVFLLPVFTKRYEAHAQNLNAEDCMEEAGL